MSCFASFVPLVSVFIIIITLQRCVSFVCTPTLAPGARTTVYCHLGPISIILNIFLHYLVVFIFINYIFISINSF